jgi:hypothetical protein
VLTTAMSSMSIAVAAQTTTSVQRFVVMFDGSEGEGAMRRPSRSPLP